MDEYKSSYGQEHKNQLCLTAQPSQGQSIVEMSSNKANAEAKMNEEKIPMDNSLSLNAIKAYHENYKIWPCPGEVKPPAASLPSPVLDLPPEIRNKIYFMVIDDIRDSINVDWNRRAADEFSLCQPALARANRQLRHEILPIFYHEKRFDIRIYPRRHAEADEVWNKFLGFFQGLTTDLNGVPHLSHLHDLEIELWHPDVDTLCRGGLRPEIQSLQEDNNQTDIFPLHRCNGVFLHFETVPKPDEQRVGLDGTDWTDRALVRALIKDAIVKNRRDAGPRFRFGRDKLELFWKTYPWERLVDLVMMVVAECKDAARFIYIETCFAYPPRDERGGQVLRRSGPNRAVGAVDVDQLLDPPTL